MVSGRGTVVFLSRIPYLYRCKTSFGTSVRIGLP